MGPKHQRWPVDRFRENVVEPNHIHGRLPAAYVAETGPRTAPSFRELLGDDFFGLDYQERGQGQLFTRASSS